MIYYIGKKRSISVKNPFCTHVKPWHNHSPEGLILPLVTRMRRRSSTGLYSHGVGMSSRPYTTNTTAFSDARDLVLFGREVT